MLDLTTMKTDIVTKRGKKAVKTFLTAAAHERLMLAAEFVGVSMHELVEKLIMTQLPEMRRTAARYEAKQAKANNET